MLAQSPNPCIKKIIEKFMKTELRQPEKASHTIQSKTKAANQAPVQKILQRYQDATLQMAELDEEELLQGKFETVQREILEEDELLQGKFEETSQLIELDEDEELPLQGKSDTTQREVLEDEELPQGKFETTQRKVLDDDELLQGKFEDTTQLQDGQNSPSGDRGVNNTGLPDTLKSGIENLSGYSMDDVHVHYNSDKPAQLHALAYTQGTDIHVAPGQEKHLPHEAWHVVQQKQGRVHPTTQLQGVNINDNEGLEREADVKGVNALQMKITRQSQYNQSNHSSTIIQRMVGFEFETGWKIEKKVYKKELYRDSEGWWGIGFFNTRATNEFIWSRLDKKEIIGEYRDSINGFHLEADDASSGKSEIEFVTKPFESREDLISSMDDIQRVGELLIESSRSKDENGDFQKWGFKITPCDETLGANPQMTFGMGLDKLDPFINESGILMNEIDKTKDIILSESSQLAILVRLIQQYIIQGSMDKGNEYGTRPLSYPKQIADVIMARTDFGMLLELAMKENKKKITLDQWLTIFTNLGVNIENKLFACGILKDDNKEDELQQKKIQLSEKDYLIIRKKYIYIPKLTIREWLVSIYNKKDYLAKMKDHEGMGGLGKKTDKVNSHNVGIFEYRGLQRSPKILSEWKDFAIEWYDKVNNHI